MEPELVEEEIQATKVELATIIQKQDMQVQELTRLLAVANKEQGLVLAFTTFRYIAIGVFLWWVSGFVFPWLTNIAQMYAPVQG